MDSHLPVDGNTSEQSGRSQNVLVLGAGSIGGVYIYQLQQAGCSVTAVCRSNYSIVKEQGFRLNSVRFGNVTYKPDHVVRSIAELDQRFDFVLVCLKSFPDDTPTLAEMLQPMLKDQPDTGIVLAQNGIMIEEAVSVAFPNNPLLSGVVYCPAHQTGPGVIEYPEMLSLLELGTYPANAPASHKAAAQTFADLMIAGGGGAEVHENIQISRWSKLMFNAVWNPICALTLCTDGGFLTTSDPFAYELAWETMMEISQLAETVGVSGVTKEVAKEKFEITKGRSEKGTGREMSMLQDIRQSRPLEVEAIVGNAVRIARKHGLKLVRLETIYALTKARNVAMLRDRK